jgi:hypothetical protein
MAPTSYVHAKSREYLSTGFRKYQEDTQTTWSAHTLTFILKGETQDKRHDLTLNFPREIPCTETYTLYADTGTQTPTISTKK